MKNYNYILITITCLMVSISAGVMLWSQPISGDLTRISAYPERWFGWNDQQQDIPAIINSKRAKGKKHLLVIGDSFSEAGHWQALLEEKYSFSFIHNGKTNLGKILDKIRNEKPDAVVIETAERAIPDMYGSGAAFMRAVNKCDLPAPSLLHTENFAPLSEKIKQLPNFPLKERVTAPRSGNNISEGYHTIKIYAKSLIKPQKRKAKTLELTSNQLFSNNSNARILLLSKDFLLDDSIDQNGIHTIQCSMQSLASTLNEIHIPYVILAIPDKSTAYQNYLANEEIRQRPALINRLHINQIKHGIDMLPAIQAMIAAGNKDVYLPNDTHWGHKGFQIAAALLDMEFATQLPNNSPKEPASYD
jgi:hypothetical protein